MSNHFQSLSRCLTDAPFFANRRFFYLFIIHNLCPIISLRPADTRHVLLWRIYLYLRCKKSLPRLKLLRGNTSFRVPPIRGREWLLFPQKYDLIHVPALALRCQRGQNVWPPRNPPVSALFMPRTFHVCGQSIEVIVEDDCSVQTGQSRRDQEWDSARTALFVKEEGPHELRRSDRARYRS